MLGGKFLNYIITEELYREYNLFFLIQSAWGVYPWVFKLVINQKKQFGHLKIIMSLKDLDSILRISVGKNLQLSLENIQSTQQFKQYLQQPYVA